MNQYKKKKKHNKIKRKYYKRKSNFKKGLLTAWLIFVGIILASLATLWLFLGAYEKGSPEYVLKQIVEDLENQDTSKHNFVDMSEDAVGDGQVLIDTKYVSDFLKTSKKKHGYTFRKINTESDDKTNVYIIKASADNLIRVSLVKTNKKIAFKFYEWAEQSSTFVGALEPKTVDIQVPTGGTLYINGIVVSPNFITEQAVNIKILDRLINLGIVKHASKVDTYKVRGVFAEPIVTVKDENGAEEPCKFVKGIYTAGYEMPEEEINEQIPRISKMIEVYARYFTKDASRWELQNIVYTNSPAYESAISTDISWIDDHNSVEITDKVIDNFVKYSDDCFACDVKFKQTIVTDWSVTDWDTNMTWVFAYENGNFYLADFMTNVN